MHNRKLIGSLLASDHGTRIREITEKVHTFVRGKERWYYARQPNHTTDQWRKLGPNLNPVLQNSHDNIVILRRNRSTLIEKR